MLNTSSPLESLTAFAIVFVAGVVSTATLGAYIGRVRKAAQAQCPASAGLAATAIFRHTLFGYVAAAVKFATDLQHRLQKVPDTQNS